MKITSNTGMLLLAAWLILQGATPLLNLNFAAMGTVSSVLALVAGVFLLVGK
ncbi:MAG: hypothetical protein AB7G28_23205 [Pirellulales bacterium]